MKQILTELRRGADLDCAFAQVREEQETGNYRCLLLHVYSGTVKEELILKVCRALRVQFPEAMIAGTLSAGEIREGRLMERGILVSAMFFERADVRLLRFPDAVGHEIQIGDRIRAALDKIPQIKAGELLLPGTELNTRVMFERIGKCAPGIRIFGGYAGGHGLDAPEHFVFDDQGIYTDQVFVIAYAGEDFHISVEKSAGWQTLGMPFKVTKADENRLIELDHRPAVEVYEKYLQIDRNDNFAENTFEFPLMAKVNGEELLRHTILVEEDGTLLLAGYVQEGMDIYLCYGNPSSIVEKVNARLEEVSDFAPEAILLYSCSVRKSFWEDFVDMEMKPFQEIAVTAGFHTWGEVKRDLATRDILEYNITLLSIAMREGEAKNRPAKSARVDDTVLKGQASLMQRLTKLVYATTAELQKAYEDLSILNDKLTHMAETDGLTGMYNRRKIELLINEALDAAADTGREAFLIMVDIDHFKQVNDTYGHDIGDVTLKQVAETLMAAVENVEGGHAGRWGGEEFFLVLPGTGAEEGYRFAEALRERIASQVFPTGEQLTVSLGVIDTLGRGDRKKIYAQVDDALYLAKGQGRNRVIRA